MRGRFTWSGMVESVISMSAGCTVGSGAEPFVSVGSMDDASCAVGLGEGSAILKKTLSLEGYEV
jgi:hypothetical protein